VSIDVQQSRKKKVPYDIGRLDVDEPEEDLDGTYFSEPEKLVDREKSEHAEPEKDLSNIIASHDQTNKLEKPAHDIEGIEERTNTIVEALSNADASNNEPIERVIASEYETVEEPYVVESDEPADVVVNILAKDEEIHEANEHEEIETNFVNEQATEPENEQFKDYEEEEEHETNLSQEYSQNIDDEEELETDLNKEYTQDRESENEEEYYEEYEEPDLEKDTEENGALLNYDWEVVEYDDDEEEVDEEGDISYYSEDDDIVGNYLDEENEIQEVEEEEEEREEEDPRVFRVEDFEEEEEEYFAEESESYDEGLANDNVAGI